MWLSRNTGRANVNRLRMPIFTWGDMSRHLPVMSQPAAHINARGGALRHGTDCEAAVPSQQRGWLHVTNNFDFARKMLRGGTALHALALLGAGVSAVAMAAPAAAQDYSQVNATGRVQGTNGQPIAGATVTVTSNDQGNTRSVTTGNDGAFRVPALPQGSYTFVIEAAGYDALTDNAVTLTQAGAANQFTLATAGASVDGDIVVTAGRVQVVDFTQNTTGAVINVGELATRVPVARDITSVILLAPGTVQGDSAFGNLPSVAGSSVSENTYYINGLNITNFRNGLGGVAVPFDFYQTVDVKNGGYSAEFGRATGGFINATTKSGSNEFHGGITFNWEPDDLRDDSPRTYATDNDSRFSDRKEMIAQLSGPIIKDHLFFYGLYQSRNVTSGFGTTAPVSSLDPRINPNTGLSRSQTQVQLDNSCFINPTVCAPATGLGLPSNRPTTPTATNPLIDYAIAGTGYTRSTTNSPFYGGKLDAVIVDGQRLEFTYFNTTQTTRTNYSGTAFFSLASGGRYNPNTNNPGSPLPQGQGGVLTEKSGGENYVARYTGTFTNWLTVSAAYGRNNNDTTTSSSGPTAPAITDSRNGVSVPLGNPVTGRGFTSDKRDFYRADVDLFFKLFGTHHIRGGYDREDLVGRSSSSYNGDYAFTYGQNSAFANGAGQYVSRRYFLNGGEYQSKSEAYYIEDNWALFENRLQLNLGIRNDRFTNENNLGQAFFKSGDNWGPRLGFTLDPEGAGRTKIYGSFSRYFLGVPVNTNTRLAGLELDYTQYYNLAGTNADNTPIYGSPFNDNDNIGTGDCPRRVVDTVNGGTANCTVNQSGEQPPFRSLVSQTLKAQSVDEYILGIQQRYGSRWVFGAYYTERNLRRSLEDGYIDKGVLGFCARSTTLTAAQKQECVDTFTGAHQYALINPGYSATVDLNAIGTSIDGLTAEISPADLQLPKAQRRYKSMTLTADREFDGVWSLSASYTLSALVGNIEGGIRSDNGQSDSGLTTAFDFPALMDGAFGYLPGHNRHNIKLFGSVQPLPWLNLGANLQINSPRKFGCIGRVPNTRDPIAGGGYGAAGFYCNVVNGEVITYLGQDGFVFSNPNTNFPDPTPSATNTLKLTPRGSQFQSDWLYNLGLDVAIKVPTDAFDGTIRLSVFNVLNSRQKLDFNEVGTLANGQPNATYRLPTSYQTPRFFRVQFGVNF
jgi:hypothetical protein